MKLSRVFLDNGWLKLLSVGVAVGVWFLISQKSYSWQDVKVPVNILIPEDRFILVKSPDEVQLTLRGPAPVMKQLRPGNLQVELKAQKAHMGGPAAGGTLSPVRVPISASDIRNLLPNIEVIRIDPSTATITLDQIIEKRILVKENLAGKAKDGLRIIQAYCDPKHVIVRGPMTVLAKRETITTLPVPVENLDAGTWQPTRRLDTSDGNLADCLRPDPPAVRVWIEVVPEGENRTVQDVPIEIRGLPGIRYTLLTRDKTKPFIQIPEVEIKGPKTLLDKPDLRAYIDVTDVREPRQNPEDTREVQFSAAPQIEVLTKPPSVVVQIKADKTERE